MPTTRRVFATVLTLFPALLAGAQAQPAAGTWNPGSQAPATQQPSGANPTPQTPTPQAPDLRTYVSMLDKAQVDLRAQLSRAEGHVAPTQNGAMSPTMFQLMQKVREAWDTAERAPRGFTDNPTYAQASRDIRHHFADMRHGEVPPPEAMDAARAVLEALDQIRDAANKAQNSSPS